MENIEDEYRQRFSDYEEEPSDELWSKIQGKLPTNIPTKPENVSLPKNYIVFGLLALVIFTATYFSYEFSKTNLHKNNNDILTIKKPIIATTDESEISNKNVVKQANEKIETNEIINHKVTTNDLAGKNLPNKKNNLSDKKSIEIEEGNASKISKNKTQYYKVSSNNSIYETNKIIYSEREKIAKKITVFKAIEKVNSANELVNVPKNKEESLGKTLQIKINNNSLQENNEAINLTENNTILPQKNEFKVDLLTNKSVNFANQKYPNKAINWTKTDVKKTHQQQFSLFKPKQFFVGINPTGLVNYYNFRSNNFNALEAKDFNVLSKKFNFSIQLGALYPILQNEKLNLRLALNLVNTNLITQYKVTDKENPNTITALGNYQISLADNSKLYQEIKDLRSVGITSDLLYYYNSSGAFVGGLELNMPIQKLSSPQVNIYAGLHFDKPIAKKINFWVEPSITTSLARMPSVENLFTQKITSFRIRVGFSFLNK